MHRCGSTICEAANPRRVASRLLIVIVSLLLMFDSALAVEGGSGSIIADYNRAMADFTRAYMTGGTSENRERILRERYPQSAPYAEKLLAVAQRNPTDPAAFDALQWIIEHDGPGARFEDACMLLAEHFTGDPRAKSVVLHFMSTVPTSVAAEAFLSSTVAHNPDRDTRGIATYTLGRFYKKQAEAVSDANHDPVYAGLKQSRIQMAESTFRTTQSEYGDVVAGPQFTLGQSADDDLFELRSPLAVGKIVPEITGEDIDGRPMTLSEFRGKVVMLDFWGDW